MLLTSNRLQLILSVLMMASKSSRYKLKHLVGGYIRRQCNVIAFPIDLLEIIEEFYYSRLLQFSNVYKSTHGFDFFDDRTLLRRVPSPLNEGYKYILVDNVPVFEGQHCWRVKVKNPRNDMPFSIYSTHKY